MSEKSKDLGVICARFQVAELHPGHLWLINEVLSRHERVLITLGVTMVKMSPVNPLTFNDRTFMISQSFASDEALVFDRINDHPDDAYWSRSLDATISKHVILAEGAAVLYGSRGSFMPYYSGIFPTVELDSYGENYSGTAHRKEVCANPPHTLDYRKGKIAACADRYPINYMTADAVIYNREHNAILLGRKPGNTLFQFCGGFTDPTDENLEAAAAREAGEEVIYRFNDSKLVRPLKVESTEYLGSLRINDSRYRNEIDKIMTAVILCITKDYDYLEGADDIEEVRWYSLAALGDNNLAYEQVHVVHHPILKLLEERLIRPTTRQVPS